MPQRIADETIYEEELKMKEIRVVAPCTGQQKLDANVIFLFFESLFLLWQFLRRADKNKTP